MRHDLQLRDRPSQEARKQYSQRRRREQQRRQTELFLPLGGEARAVDAAKQAIDSPLLEESVEGATGILLNITGGKELGRDGCRVPLPWFGQDRPFGFSPIGASAGRLALAGT